MTSLVSYSDPESDDSDDRAKKDHTPTVETKLISGDKAGHQINQPVSKIPSQTVPHNDIDTALTKSILESSDYFGLENESSDGSDGETDQYFARGKNIWSKPIESTRSNIRNVPQNITNKSPQGTQENNFEKNLNPKTGIYNNGNNSREYSNSNNDFPDSEFWAGKDKITDWQKPEKIWGVSSTALNAKKSAPSVNELGSDNVVGHKRQKLGELDEPASSTSHPKQLSKNCFFVHHKITPALHCPQPCRPPKERFVVLRGHNGAVNRIKWDKGDFSHLLATASMDRTVKIWNVYSSISPCIQTFISHTKAVKDVTWSPSGKEILSCGYDRTARLFDVIKGVEISRFEHNDFIFCAKYHPVNPNYFVAGSKDQVLCWDVRCPEKCMKTFNYKHKFGQVQDLAFIQDGREFVISTDLVSRDSADRSIMVFDFGSGVVLSNQVYQERYTCPRLAIHPRQSEMMAQSSGNYACLFSTIRPYKMNKCKRFEGHKVLGYSIGCDYSPDGSLVVSGSAESKVKVWDHQRAILLAQLGDPHEIYLDVAWHPLLNSTIAGCTWSGNIDIWQ